MKKRNLTLLVSLLIVVLLLVGCAAADQEEAAVEEPVVEEEVSDEATLLFSGSFAEDVTYTESELRAMETMDVEDVDNDGEATTRTGVSLNTLLDEAGVSDEAVTLVFITNDGSETEVDLAEVRACAECIIAFRNNGGFRMTLPGFPNSAQVRGVIEIRAQ